MALSTIGDVYNQQNDLDQKRLSLAKLQCTQTYNK